jgi:hypothetical protein
MGWAYIIMACITIATTLCGILFNVCTILAEKCKTWRENRKTKMEPIEIPQRINKYNLEKDPSIDGTRVEEFSNNNIDDFEKQPSSTSKINSKKSSKIKYKK